jgi:hypothetical protein
MRRLWQKRPRVKQLEFDERLGLADRRTRIVLIGLTLLSAAAAAVVAWALS